MDRNTIIGLVLIVGIFIGYTIISSPSEEQVAEQRRLDSIHAVNQAEADREKARIEQEARAYTPDELISSDSLKKLGLDSASIDSVSKAKATNKYGAWSVAAQGEKKFITLENNKMKITIATQGGRPYKVELKEYQTYDSLPLVLLNGDSTIFNLTMFNQMREINTGSLFFEEVNGHTKIIAESDQKSAVMRLTVAPGKYLEYKYSLAPDSYMVDFDIKFVGISDIIDPQSGINMNWSQYAPQQEKGRTFENTYTCIYYRNDQGEVDNLTESNSSDENDLPTHVKWIGFKQQFFSSIIVADNFFDGANLVQTNLDDSDEFLKKFEAQNIGLVYNATANETIGLQWYFGPNHYNTLKDLGYEFEEVIDLGWPGINLINKWFVIPVFNFLEKYISSYGIIILILTLLLKLVLFPIAYKSYVSTAKMRVLKPQIDAINEKIPKEKTMERQQATMALYKKAGANPLGGCVPMLLQFPILIAMFRFFPASIELRQQSFLWADDLSSYDNILTVFGVDKLPFSIPIYGDHISLFTLLMTVSTIFYTRIQQSTNPVGGGMPGMKLMMYMMPLMFLFMFNSYASGLSYYYFLANIITFGQMWIIKQLINEEDLLLKLEENKKKPVKKSNFAARLEKMAKQKGYQPPKRK